jgi:flagellar biogenesis protein FliO
VLASSAEQSVQAEKPFGSMFAAILGRFRSLASSQRIARRLRVCETLSLGEKRSILVVEYDGHKFLLAATPQNISLLHCLKEDSAGKDSASRTEAQKSRTT